MKPYQYYKPLPKTVTTFVVTVFSLQTCIEPEASCFQSAVGNKALRADVPSGSNPDAPTALVQRYFKSQRPLCRAALSFRYSSQDMYAR